jgi:ubiquinone/menaquinone biosynthesis C-methylase UbiE
MAMSETTEPRATAILFSDLAVEYDRFSRTLSQPEAPIRRWLDENLGTGHRALDVGCGTGRYSELMADRFDEVVGIDAAAGMVEFARAHRARPNVTYAQGDVLRLEPADHGLFDVVLAFSLVLHVGTPETVLGALRRVVAPGGRLIVVEPERPPTWGQEGWQVDLAFGVARAAFEATDDIEDAVTALRLVLSPNWMKISRLSRPPTRAEFVEQYGEALPGLTIEEGLPGCLVALWRAPAGAGEPERSSAAAVQA